MGKLPVQKGTYRDLVSAVYGDRPSSAMIEVADRCNEACVHCYQVQGQKGEMATEEITGILRDLAASGVLFLTVSGGEATLRSDLVQIIREARGLGFVVTLFTNGLRMTRELARELAALEVLRVELSLYGDEAESHDWVTQVPGSFDKTVAGIRHLVEAGVAVMVKTPLMVTNMRRQDEYEAWVTSLGAIPSISPDLMPREGGDRSPEALRADRESTLAAFERSGLLPERGLPSAPVSKPLCGACKNVHIEPNGQIRPCTMLDVPIGDAKAGNIVAQVRSSPAAQLMRSVRWNDVPGCNECALVPHCHRCHAKSLAEVGDALRPYPSACRTALMRWEHETGRDAGFDWAADDAVGPFREVNGRLEAFEPSPDTPEQVALYREHPWLKGEPSHPVPPARPGALVQLRRPGREAKMEKVPGAAAGTDPVR